MARLARNSKAEPNTRAAKFGEIFSTRKESVEAIVEQQFSKSELKLDDIKDRLSDTRELDQKHVEALAESIAIVGLIEPLVVDQKGRLLAGGHRKAAIAYLRETEVDRYDELFPSDRIPVRVMSFDADQEESLALQVEISENEKRRDYTKAEVRAIAEKLKAAGYHHTKGRPSKGAKPLLPALETIVGKSIAQLKRYLGDEPIKNSSSEPLSELRRAMPLLKKWCDRNPDEELTEVLLDAVGAIEEHLNEENT